MRSSKRIFCIIFILVFWVFMIQAYAGNKNTPSGSPDSADGAMHSLEDIYNFIKAGGENVVEKRGTGYSDPESEDAFDDSGPIGTGYTINEVYQLLRTTALPAKESGLRWVINWYNAHKATSARSYDHVDIYGESEIEDVFTEKDIEAIKELVDVDGMYYYEDVSEYNKFGDPSPYVMRGEQVTENYGIESCICFLGCVYDEFCYHLGVDEDEEYYYWNMVDSNFPPLSYCPSCQEWRDRRDWFGIDEKARMMLNDYWHWAGVEWPRPRFTIFTYGSCDDSDEDCTEYNDTVKDNMTGLEWARDMSPGLTLCERYKDNCDSADECDWLSYYTVRTCYCYTEDGDRQNIDELDCRTLVHAGGKHNYRYGASNYTGAKVVARGSRIGGYSDWRVPSVLEFLSIIDLAHVDPALSDADGGHHFKEGDPFLRVPFSFPGSLSYYDPEDILDDERLYTHWTSTERDGEGNDKYVIMMDLGDGDMMFNTSPYTSSFGYVLLVRRGQEAQKTEE